MTLLYKYRACSDQNDFDLLVKLLKGDFWFPLARDVNDPFEFRCGVDYSFSLEGTIKAFTIVECYSDPLTTRSDALKKVFDVFRNLTDEQIRLRHRELSLDLWRRLASETTMCCFSATAVSTLLWSHYARGHTGVAIEAEPTSLRPLTYRVEYSDKSMTLPALHSVVVDPEGGSRLLDDEW
jgi:hypothetical protein